MYTEEEAKKKWCYLPEMNKCVASDCMAWRWIKNNTLCPDPQDYKTEYDFNRAMEMWQGRKQEQPKGFCGVAGKP